jgi:hypothetical protein
VKVPTDNLVHGWCTAVTERPIENAQHGRET